MTQFLLPIALVANGLAAGGLAIAVLGGAPLMFVLPLREYVIVQQFLTTRFDPFMPICMVTTIVFDATLWFVAPEPARWLAGLAGLLTACAITVSLTRNFPINRWVRKLDPDNLPDNWEAVDPRVRWRDWNAVRASLVAIALLVNVTAVGVLV
ncbi:MAG: anthrone oxygenase family protein [Micromonosporaceae bacterium]